MLDEVAEGDEGVDEVEANYAEQEANEENDKHEGDEGVDEVEANDTEQEANEENDKNDDEK